MTDHITEPVTPNNLDPAPLAPLAGDWHDDDPIAYEGDFQAADHTPGKWQGVPHTVVELPVPTRLLTRAVVVGTVNGAIADPIQILPADVNRKALTIEALATVAATFRLGAEKTNCYDGQVFSAPANVPVIMSIDAHTGALWAYSDSANSVTVSVVAVTK